MDINRFQGQGILTTYEGDKIPIEIFRHNNEMNIIIDRYQIKLAAKSDFISNYNYVIVANLNHNGKIETYAWKAGMDGYKLKVHPKHELIQLVGILTDFLYVDHIKPIMPGQMQKVEVKDGLQYELNFDNEMSLLSIIRHDDPGYGVRAKLMVEFDRVTCLDEVPYHDNCPNYQFRLDYYDEHVTSFIDALNEEKIAPHHLAPRSKDRPTAIEPFDGSLSNEHLSNCTFGACGNTYNCNMSGCRDINRPLPAGFQFGTRAGVVDFRDMGTAPHPRVAMVNVTPPSTTRIVQQQPPIVDRHLHYTEPIVQKIVEKQDPVVQHILEVPKPKVHRLVYEKPPKVHTLVHQQPPQVHEVVRRVPPKVTDIHNPAQFDLTGIVSPPRYGLYGTGGTLAPGVEPKPILGRIDRSRGIGRIRRMRPDSMEGFDAEEKDLYKGFDFFFYLLLFMMISLLFLR